MTNEQKFDITALQAELNSAASELKNIVAQRQAEIDSKSAAASELKSVLETIVARMDTIETKMARPAVAPEVVDAAPAPSERKASFLAWMKKGERKMTNMQLKALVEDATGEYLVPEDVEAEIIRALPHLTIMRGLATIRQTTSDRVRIRSMDEVAVGWGKVEVTASMSLTNQTPAQTYMYVEDLYAMCQVGEDELADTDANLEALIADSFARAVAYAEDKAFLVGTGHANGQPDGILNGTTVTAVNTKQNAAVTGDDFLSLVYAVPTQYRGNACFIVNSKTELALRMLKDGKGQYLWQASVQQGRPNTFFGHPIYNQEDIPDIPAAGNAAKVAVFGDIKAGYRIVDRQGMSLTRLNERYAELALIGFRIHKRVGGGVVRADALRVLNVIA